MGNGEQFLRHSGEIIAKKEELSIIDCIQCGWAHLQPLPDVQEIEEFYKREYYSDSSWFEKEQREHEKGLWEVAYEFQANLLGSRHVVDWGCGAGFFPNWWRIRHYPQLSYAYGIEPNDYARSYFNYPFVFPDAFCLRNLETNHRASMLFEHAVKPRVLLAQMKNSLWKKILIIVPHDGPTNTLQTKLGGNWWVDERHLHYWSPRGLTNLLKGMGLHVTYRGATFPIELLVLLTGKDYRNDSAWGAKCHLFRLNFEKRLGLTAFRLYSTLHKKCGWGRELMYVAEEGR